MDIKKIAVTEVHRTIEKDYKSLYKVLKRVLGDDMPFAEFNIGPGYYIWSDSRGGWRQAIGASEMMQEFVFKAFEDEKEAIRKKLGQADADKLLVMPDDGYLYFKEENGTIKVLITGWAFRKPVARKAQAEVIEEDVFQRNPVTLSFVADGKAIPNRAFVLRLAKIDKAMHTDDQGIFYISDIKPGESYGLIDSETQKEFVLSVTDGVNHYDFEVEDKKPEPVLPDLEPEPEPEPETPKTNKISLKTYDGKPLLCDTLVIKQEGNEDFVLKIDENGEGTLPADAFAAEKSVSAKIEGAKDDFVDYAPIEFAFDKDEREYVLQEIKPNKWKKILAITLFVIAFLTVATLLWWLFDWASPRLYNWWYE